ncbi:MAG: tetratricopeptide repeat protein [Paracoccaceae bacterium]
MRGYCSALLALALAGFLSLTQTAAAEPLVLDAESLRKLAFDAVRAGFAEDALEMTDALLVRDPEDASALTIRAQALRALGQHDAAIEAARDAWAAADTDAARFGAAMAMAAAQSSAGNRTRAELWLRRAANTAPNERAYAIAQRDFGYVQSRNPWRFVLDVNASPSSNVNNGSSQSSFALPGLPFLFEIDPANQALSGIELGFGLEAIYRLSPTGPNRQTSLTFGTSVKSVALSAEARAAVPDARNSDFTLASLEFGVQHRRGLGAAGDRILMLTGTVGHNWYGGQDLSNYLQLSASLMQPLGERATLTWGIDADRITRLDRRPQSSDRVEISAILGFGVGQGGEDRLSVRLSGTDVASASVEVRNQAMGLNVSWEKADPVAGIGIAATLGLEQRVFGDSRYVVGGREDNKLTAKVELTFTEVNYFGFSPVLEIQATRNRSNSALHDSRALGVNLGIASTF